MQDVECFEAELVRHWVGVSAAYVGGRGEAIGAGVPAVAGGGAPMNCRRRAYHCQWCTCFLCLQVSESEVKPVEQGPQRLAGASWPAVVRETIQGALNTRLIAAKDQIVSIYHR